MFSTLPLACNTPELNAETKAQKLFFLFFFLYALSLACNTPELNAETKAQKLFFPFFSYMRCHWRVTRLN